MEKLLEITKRRRATKKYDETKKISQENLDYILQVANSAPTSMGLQAWRIINLKSEQSRLKYIEGINLTNRDSFLKASDVFIYITKKASWFDANNPELISWQKDMSSKILKYLYNETSFDDDKLKERLNYIEKADHGNNGDLTEWSKRQAYIVLAFTLISASELGIDSTPVEGFNRDLEKMLLKDDVIKKDESVTLIAFLGYGISEGKKYNSEEQIRQEWKTKITNI